MKMQKLLNIQKDLRAPKSQYNSFGKYNYRNCEDILESVKPLCDREKACLTLSDSVVQIGDRYYIQAVATLYDCESGDIINAVTAYAREEAEKKGMDGSQVTGAASSYARKYALNGLFNIDDNKDADSYENSNDTPPKTAKSPKENNTNKEQDELEKALKTAITIAGKEYVLEGIPLNWLQSHVEKASPELKKAMEKVITYKMAQEIKNGDEELPFK